ncbi:methionine ABC transporter ATP-binding protein [Vagococcus xieshaowenii]|uniref:ATP-binding cassette domain-containing protein n=1 Tax=Vagococcus xieshaowenii TaxID=2562451 RepID=A0AAJ5EF07_9ENTE|nr:ATP-binding cassette domain-containing protein [Vagococcus xieshaowenii]QCA29033.1 ATP-binding cassette domain-containing protein [Vagococcus xieshaowenii]TFZ40991.1 ATP-binding cassette domain-containing protein [Vagococcus xieshaowenii]
MIELKNISKIYQQNQKSITALNSVSLHIKPNEFFGLVGESGSGKSTLLKLMNRLEVPTSGDILINGQSLNQMNEQEVRKMVQKTAMIFQQFNLLQNQTVKQNVKLPLKLQGKSDDKLVANVLEFVGMTPYQDKYPVQLSGGQKQRVAIARALVTKPDILLCDEPTSALDSQNSFEVMKLLKQVQTEFGTTVIFVSHELPLIKQWCERAGIMEKGNLLAVIEVEPEEVVTQSANYYEQVVEYLQ